MTDHGSDRGDRNAVTADVGDDQSRRGDGVARSAAAAEGPVLVTRDLNPLDTSKDTEAVAHPLIESSLVGEGGTAVPASRRQDDTDRDQGEAGATPPAAVDDNDMSATSVLADKAREPLDRPVWGAAAVPAPTDAAPVTGRPSETSLPPTRRPEQGAESVRRGGFWPLALGGVVAAGLGAGAAILVMPQIMPQVGAPPADLTSNIEAAAGEAARAAVDSLSQQVIADARQAGADAGAAAGTKAAQAAIDAGPATTADAAPQAAAIDPDILDRQAERIAALEAQVAQLGTATAAPAQSGPAGTQTDAPASAADTAGSLPTQTAAAPANPGADLTELLSRIEAQAKQLDALAARPTLDPATADSLRQLGDDAAATRQAIDATAQRVEAQLKDIGEKSDILDQKVAETAKRAENTAAIVALESALAQGGDGTVAAARLKEAGVEPPAALTVPVPALRTLQADFPQAARAGLRAALRADESGSAGGRGLMNFLRAQTGARSVTPREGDDPDAILSRAGAAVSRGEIATALAEIETLPPAARQVMSGWVQPATAWSAAHDALDALKTTTP